MLRREKKNTDCDRHCLKTLSLLQGDLWYLTLQLSTYVYLKAFLQRLTEWEDWHIIHLYLSLGKEHQAYKLHLILSDTTWEQLLTHQMRMPEMG